MTYRRLYRYLLVAATILLAGTWWNSFRTINSLIAMMPGGMPVSGGTVVAIHCGTATVLWLPGASGGKGQFDLRSDPVFNMSPEDRYGVMGKFQIKAGSAKDLEPYRAHLPLWFVYLVFASGGYGLLRWSERRAAGSAEKALALDVAKDDLTPYPGNPEP